TTLIDMSSATDGWAIASKSANGDTPLIVLHYTNGRWTRVLTHMQGKINALKVLSATNGWAIGDHIYHYDGRTWQEVFAPGQNKEDQYETIAVAAPSSVWITSQNDSSQILYFDGSAWTWQNLPSPATRGLLYNQINSISMTSGHEGWAVARMSYMAPSNAPYPLSVVLHYADGVWSVDRTCQQCELTTVSAVSPSVVWIGGSRDTSTGPNTARLMPLLWQLSDGNWRDVPIPNSFGRGPLTGQVGRIQMLSTTEGWMIAYVGDAVAGGAQYNPLFYLKNRQWVETSVLSVPIPTVGMALAFVSSSEFWGLGEYGISHYLHGVWKNVVA
ncbi:MAG TPA: hypothetical protein VFN11_10360, partial [Ktedonobacterales bacterium]|nr:hypothetical protein [Ktedonobacterales bacterium]